MCDKLPEEYCYYDFDDAKKSRFEKISKIARDDALSIEDKLAKIPAVFEGMADEEKKKEHEMAKKAVHLATFMKSRVEKASAKVKAVFETKDPFHPETKSLCKEDKKNLVEKMVSELSDAERKEYDDIRKECLGKMAELK